MALISWIDRTEHIGCLGSAALQISQLIQFYPAVYRKRIAKAAVALMEVIRQATRLFSQMQIKSIIQGTSHPGAYLQINMLTNDPLVSKFLLKLVGTGSCPMLYWGGNLLSN